MTETFKIDLNNIIKNKQTKNEIRLNEFSIITPNKNELVIMKDNDNSENAKQIIAEYKNNSWYFNGKNIDAIWQTLENHFEAIQKIINELNH